VAHPAIRAVEYPGARPHPVRDRSAILLPVAIVLVLAVVRVCFTRPIIEDEVAHLPQIERFVAGDWTLVPGLTTIPGHHATLALVATAAGTHSLEAMRTANVVVAALCIGVLALLLRRLHGRVPGHRLLQLAFFPITFPCSRATPTTRTTTSRPTTSCEMGS